MPDASHRRGLIAVLPLRDTVLLGLAAALTLFAFGLMPSTAEASCGDYVRMDGPAHETPVDRIVAGRDAHGGPRQLPTPGNSPSPAGGCRGAQCGGRVPAVPLPPTTGWNTGSERAALSCATERSTEPRVQPAVEAAEPRPMSGLHAPPDRPPRAAGAPAAV